MRRIDAFNVERRVGFRIAQPLSLLQRRRKCRAVVGHGREDKIGCAVDDTGEPFHLIAHHPAGQCIDDRNAARHCGFKAQHDAFSIGVGNEFVAVARDDRLIGRHHRLFARYGVSDELQSRIFTADQFDDDVDIGVVQRAEICRKIGGTEIDLRFWRTTCHTYDRQRSPGSTRYLARVDSQDLQQPLSHRAKPGDAYSKRIQVFRAS